MKILKLERVSYGKDSTPEEFREYKIKDYPGSPVGTLDEWKFFAKEHKFDAVDIVETHYWISEKDIRLHAIEVE